MRFISDKKDGYQIFAVSGVNTVAFAIEASGADTTGLLGFAVERADPKENERFFVRGYKVFEDVIKNPDENTIVSTFDHPIQAFLWEDFTAKSGRKYQYFFHPVKGKPKNLDRSAAPIPIDIETEALYSPTDEHDVFFNRGVASSQAYTREFGNKKPDDPSFSPEKTARAFKWLGRDLPEAMLKFIKDAKAGDGLLCCFYEFRFRPAADELAAAIGRGVDVKIIIDAKVNESIDKKTGKKNESFPREDNLRMITDAGIPTANIIMREAKPDNIQHNKFMVLLKGAQKKPTAVWTGSTNLSDGGVYGQTNVGHWVKNGNVAAKYEEYWKLLSTDPGGRCDDSAADVRKKNAELKKAVSAIQPDLASGKLGDIPNGTTTIFSPRVGDKMLGNYAAMVEEAVNLSAITLAFGINQVFKDLLKDNTAQDQLTLMLLEKRDEKKKGSDKPFTALYAKNNVYSAWGSFIKNPVYQWSKETNTMNLKLNHHVAYIHSKFLLMDPLGENPVVVTGSANFSSASTISNDENMIIIRGNKRVADIYFTEFNRLFFHYYFRSVMELMEEKKKNPNFKPDPNESSLFLKPDDSWLKKYKPGTMRDKRVQSYTKIVKS